MKWRIVKNDLSYKVQYKDWFWTLNFWRNVKKDLGGVGVQKWANTIYVETLQQAQDLLLERFYKYQRERGGMKAVWTEVGYLDYKPTNPVHPANQIIWIG